MLRAHPLSFAAQPKRIENARILVANTAMDTDKIKIYGARVRVDSMAKVWGMDGGGAKQGMLYARLPPPFPASTPRPSPHSHTHTLTQSHLYLHNPKL